MNTTRIAFILGIIAPIGVFAGCSSGDERSTPHSQSGSAVCQDGINHAASCAGREAATFLGRCDGEIAAAAKKVLAKDCAQINSTKADGECDEFMASMGMCVGAAATLGPWGYRLTRIALSTSECRRNAADLIEPGMELLKAGTGETCMETNEFRPVIDIGSEETYRATGVPYPDNERNAVLSPYGLEAGDAFIVLGNVGHLDAAQVVARVPLAAFDTAQAHYLIESFEIMGIPGSHGMIRVTFDTPVVELFTQYPSSNTATAKTKDIILSVHAVAVRGGKYDPLGTGIHDGMALARGVYSIENKVKDVVINRAHKVEQYKLKMTGDEIRTYTRSYAKNSPERVFTTSYHTFGRNCGTELLQVFTEAFPERNYPTPSTLADVSFENLNEEINEVMERAENGRLLPDIVPSLVRPALEDRGVFDAPAEPWSSDPSVQAIVDQLSGP